MLQILLFLTAQLFAQTLSSTISPMSHAPELSTKTTTTTTQPTTTTSVTSTTTTQTTTVIETQVATQTSTLTATMPTAPGESTPEAESLHNNVFVFLNERIDDPNDTALRDCFIGITNSSTKMHLLTPLTAVEKATIRLQEYFESSPQSLPQNMKNIFLSAYLINNSSYCIVLPHQKNSPPDDYDQNNLLDLSGCTPLCHKELFEENSTTEILNKLKTTLQEAQKQLFLQEKNSLKKESAVLRQLFKKQIKAHDLFASDQQVDESGYTPELYKLSTQPWHFYFSGHGRPGHSIAGFDFETGEIWKTLKVLNHLSTGYLIIHSCFAGGVNREILMGRHPLFSLSENSPEYKKIQALINSLTCSYKIILCSPTNAVTKANAILSGKMINKIASEKLNDENLIKIFHENIIHSGYNLQVNQLPLIQRPHQDTFKLHLSSKKKNNADDIPSALIDNQVITAITLCKDNAQKLEVKITNKRVIQTDQLQISQNIILQPNRELVLNIKNKILQEYGHEKYLATLFPVISDQTRKKSTSKNGEVYEWYPRYPFFLSLQTEDAYHYLHTITTKERTSHLPGERGVFLCLRDLFFNANTCASTHFYFIKNIIGTNDIPQTIINKKSFGENFPQEGAPLTLSNVAIANYYNIENKVHYLLCAFSHQESYYFFALCIENEDNFQGWECIQKLDSLKHFEEKLMITENLACSKIYDRLKSYPESHPQHELIKQYLYRKKSIFLDFQNSYPLFKEDYLPEDDHAWEQLPELLKKHGEKQKGIGSIAEHQLNNQKTFAPILKKIEEYQKRPILESPILEDHENGHPEDSHI